MSTSYEEWACPLRQVVVDFDESGERFVGETVDCGATLHLSWSFSWPIPPDDDGHPWTREEIALNAYTDGWEVVCENGHTLATHSRSADDNAEPFDMPAVMAAISAKKVDRELASAPSSTEEQ